MVIRGARQVGKTTLVKLFAEHISQKLIVVNLERHTGLHKIFSFKDPALIIDEIQALPFMPAITANSILFLEEIQSTPNAMPALRYFYEERSDIPVIAAGSLLEFLLSNHNFSMPVGRIQYLHIGPLVFSEYLKALNEENLLQVLQSFSIDKKMSSTAHSRLLQLMRSYCFVGGMPEAVKRYVKTQNFKDVSEAHQSIIDTIEKIFQNMWELEIWRE